VTVSVRSNFLLIVQKAVSAAGQAGTSFRGLRAPIRPNFPPSPAGPQTPHKGSPILEKLKKTNLACSIVKTQEVSQFPRWKERWKCCESTESNLQQLERSSHRGERGSSGHLPRPRHPAHGRPQKFTRYPRTRLKDPHTFQYALITFLGSLMPGISLACVLRADLSALAPSSQLKRGPDGKEYY